ncbi:Helix-turn-helix domain-containing protein [Thiothrix caldifontis]|uniref:Helix-turn-helix domain-containing protein n=1 Tax=Thiothrix caldifontis TaxID=525918 RepID=A0A1H4C3A5_9GAMM|nr:helix-turn-helix transcriptional regulator [Thiothrix caldifontis]SEA54552.1 Helix-turn-helix domain-containing protein [Thiothrix caldifontis]
MAKTLHSPAYEHFCSLLITARETAGLTQSDVASRLARPQSFVSKYESGERRLDVLEFLQICQVLKADAQAILNAMQLRIGA